MGNVHASPSCCLCVCERTTDENMLVHGLGAPTGYDLRHAVQLGNFVCMSCELLVVQSSTGVADDTDHNG